MDFEPVLAFFLGDRVEGCLACTIGGAEYNSTLSMFFGRSTETTDLRLASISELLGSFGMTSDVVPAFFALSFRLQFFSLDEHRFNTTVSGGTGQLSAFSRRAGQATRA